jgi:RNA polymerase sigma factor (sigma-70 family)
MRTADGYLVQKCLNGEPEAFGVLVDRYKSSMYALAYSKIGDFQEAEDLTQEAFLKAYRNLRQLRRWDHFYAWLYSITSNLCKDWLRAQSKRLDREYVADVGRGALEGRSAQTYREETMKEILREALSRIR